MKTLNKPFELPDQAEKREYSYTEIMDIVNEYEYATEKTRDYIDFIKRGLERERRDFDEQFTGGFELSLFRFHYRAWHKLRSWVPYDLIDSGKINYRPIFEPKANQAYSILQLWEVYYNYRFLRRDEKNGIKEAIYEKLTDDHFNRVEIPLYWDRCKEDARLRFAIYSHDSSFMRIYTIAGDRDLAKYTDSDIEVSEAVKEKTFEPKGRFSYNELKELASDDEPPFPYG